VSFQGWKYGFLPHKILLLSFLAGFTAFLPISNPNLYTVRLKETLITVESAGNRSIWDARRPNQSYWESD
jgi:hypothetical protein